MTPSPSRGEEKQLSLLGKKNSKKGEEKMGNHVKETGRKRKLKLEREKHMQRGKKG
jgi:hypothetical protein